ncbi:MAG: LysE family translocator [Bacteroidales bacterium]
MELEILLKGYIIGLMVSIPLGPMGVMVIQRSLSKGRRSGFFSGLGAATADVMFSLVAVLGVSFVIDFVENHRFIFQLVGSLFILFIGAKIFYSDPVKQYRRSKGKRTSIWSDFLTVFFMTLSNPLAIFVFIALFAGIHLVGEEHFYLTSFMVLLGVFAGATTWWFLISWLVSHYRQRFRLKRLWWLNKITGGVIIIIGAIALVKSFFLP